MSNDKPTGPKKVNEYVCDTCHKTFQSFDLDRGTTPSGVGCAFYDCDGVGHSKSYEVDQEQEPVKPYLEWYKPGKNERRRLRGDWRDHVNRGGLLVRLIPEDHVVTKAREKIPTTPIDETRPPRRKRRYRR